MRNIALIAAALFLPAEPTFGQTSSTPVFEVASIKPSNAETGSSGITTTKGLIRARNVTLKRCIRGAYEVEDSQILGGPKWLDEDRYDIDAKAAVPVGDHELMVMLQPLLAERFKLALHRETRLLTGYALVAAKGGLKAARSDPDAGSSTSTSRNNITAKACSMDRLAQKLSEAVHLTVTNATAIEGQFDFKLDWTPEDAQAKPSSAAAEVDPGPSIFAALQEQLGLKLESRKVPTQVLVIDSAEKASAN